jgi:tetraacyldisaccharide 4'-kinase
MLSPLGWVYAGATAWRLAHADPWRAPVPVVCVGNLTAGGAGKTPVIRDLAAKLMRLDWRPTILARGYGGQATGPLRVDPTRHTAADVGDEPLLLARETPCWVGGDRARSAQAAVNEGAGIILMDDGLQNPSLAQDLRIIVVDGPVGFGNRRAIPAGPLRESIEAGLARADAIVVIGDDTHKVLSEAPTRLPRLRAKLALAEPAQVAGERLVAFCGIGRPEKFRRSLLDAGVDLADFQLFPDHHPYSDTELERISAIAARLGAEPVTTEKDWVRLKPEWRGRIRALPASLTWGDEPALLRLLDRLRDHD